MRFRRPVLLYFPLALTFILASSCSPTADQSQGGQGSSSPILIVQTSDVPSPTPFQPQAGNSANPYIDSYPIQVEPTFTPFPTQSIAPEFLPTPIQAMPPPGGGVPDYGLISTTNPLTGLPVADPSLLERRPMVIKVANSPDYVRPQSGLTLADVVYEYYIEWGDTRFIAVMYGNDSALTGPVRSGRYFDEHVARMYNAFLVFKYADPREYDYLQNSTLNEFLVVPGFGACPPFVDGPFKRESYNNIFFDTRKWAECAAKRGVDNARQSLSGGFFTDNATDNGLKAARIYSFFSGQNYNYWEYDPITHRYFRYQEAADLTERNKTETYAALTDYQTNQPVTAENVVVLFVPYIFKNQNEAEDEVYHIDLVDSGNAYIFRDGIAIPALWNRVEENQPILLTTLMGAPIYMRPGRTFYEVMGTTSPYTQEGDYWRFIFQTP